MANNQTKNSKTPNSGYEWEYAKKTDNRTTLQKILHFIYNPQTHEIFGRTLKSWGALLLFYLIFYSILALIFAGCMKLLLMTLNDKYPKWQLKESIIGTNPGLGFRPMASDTEAAAIIWFNSNTKKSWIDAMKKFKDENYKIKYDNLAKNCSYNQGNMLLEKDEFCIVDLDSFGDCSASYGYGFSHGKGVCVFLKLNRIYNWKPEYYDTLDSLPKNGIPNKTREKIEENMKSGEGKQVWLSCEGHSPHDKDNIGEIEYYPAPGFPYYFYPYLNVKNYMSPLVAVHFKNATPNVLINVECRAWAKNIHYKSSSQQREGSVHFELMIDE